VAVGNWRKARAVIPSPPRDNPHPRPPGRRIGSIRGLPQKANSCSHAAPIQGCSPQGRHPETRHLPHDAPFVRHTLTRIRHPHRPKPHGACQCRNHNDLPACDKKARCRRPKSAGSFLNRKFLIPPPLRVSCLAVPPWRFKNRSMNGTPGEVSFRAVFAPVEPHAVVTGQMPHAA
jgi:hypothetical protein